MLGSDVLQFSAMALLQHRRRTLLSLTGVAIGVTAVIFLTGLAEGARGYVLNQFSSLGSNFIVIIPGKTETSGAMPGVGSAPNDLTLDDTRALRRELTGVRTVLPVAAGNDSISFGERRRQVVVLGVTSEFLRARDLTLARGSFLPKADMDRGAPLIVIGDTVSRELFLGEDPIGQVLRMGGRRMRVIGVMAQEGERMGQDMDGMVFAPVATVMQLFNRTTLFRIMVEQHAYTDQEVTKERILSVLRERHNDEEDVTLLTEDAVLDSLTGILSTLTLGLIGIGAISIAVAGIGIMNVMLVSVSERRAEVGLLKAMGATSRQILAIFLAEAAMLSTAGGIIGLGIGWLLLQILMKIYPTLPAATPFWAVASVIGLAVCTGPIFGVIPAWRATRLDPVLALQRK
ncbi:MAG: ABC transporter permease [Deltaproteobacteria bacterium]|nr:ABC transporter permease [Deltaproteobacteria bacterium]